MKIFLLPGLGYDERIFENLDFGDYTVEALTWIEPEPAESLLSYASRMGKRILEEEEELILIGHSLGGILAQTLATLKKIPKLILIASIKSREELPWHFKMVAPLRLQYFFTKGICIHTVKYWGKVHDLVTPAEQALFKSMVSRHTNTYLQWALKTLSNWEAPKLPETTTICQIHGTKDKTFPIQYIKKPSYSIKQGSHILLYKRSEEVSAIIRAELEK
ncbi:MAG: alpha/beta fold hydrolase [Saprospiraceae bacterium]